MTLCKNVIGSFRFSLSHDLPELSCSLPHIRNREDRKPRVGTRRAGNRSGKIKLSDSNTGDTILPSINVKRSCGTKGQDQGVGSNYQNHLESFIKLPGIPDKMKHGPKPRPSEHLLKNEGPISLPQISRNTSCVTWKKRIEMKGELMVVHKTPWAFFLTHLLQPEWHRWQKGKDWDARLWEICINTNNWIWTADYERFLLL